MAKINLKRLKKLIEGKIAQFATADKKGKPNCICIEVDKLIGDSILITDNQMQKTFKNLKENKKVALVVYNPKGGSMHINLKGQQNILLLENILI